MHNLRNALKWATDHAAQFLNAAKIATVLLFAALIAAQAWAPAGAAFVLAVYAHQARIDDGSDES